jgi:hypothetical protein
MPIDEYQQLVLLARQHDQPLRGEPADLRRETAWNETRPSGPCGRNNAVMKANKSATESF